MPQRGNADQVLPTGRLAYGSDGTHEYPIKVGSDKRQIVAQREPFIFRPGATTLTNGMVAAGTRSAGVATTSGTVASSTYWSAWTQYAPLRTGKIDGLATGGIVDGQLTIGALCGAGTGKISLTARIANTANTAAPTTMLALATTVTIAGTVEVYTTYDIPYLKTDAVFNAVPFSIAIGAQHSQGGSTVIFRIMESSYLQGEIEPST